MRHTKSSFHWVGPGIFGRLHQQDASCRLGAGVANRGLSRLVILLDLSLNAFLRKISRSRSLIRFKPTA